MNELKTFILHKNFGITKGNTGKLIQMVNGKPVTLERDKPFPLLQTLKRSYQNKGYSHLKITY